MIKKRLKIFALFIFLATLPGCREKTMPMDIRAADGSYYYQNRDLGFALTLPPAFEYYQTQRTARVDHTEIGFFVPTSDQTYPQPVPGYAQPVTIDVYAPADWDKAKSQSDYRGDNRTLRENNQRIYVMIFWDERPADWQKIWSDNMRQGVLDSFKFID